MHHRARKQCLRTWKWSVVYLLEKENVTRNHPPNSSGSPAYRSTSPSWGYSRSWGYRPSGRTPGLVLVVVLVLLFVGRI